MTTSLLDKPAVLNPDHRPDAIVDRDEETTIVTTTVSNPGSQHLALYGPHGTGKTLLTKAALDAAPAESDTIYLSCIQHDTQYKVLIRIANILTGSDIASGYHTAQLQDHVADLATNRALVIVLDDIDFLLANDGTDLLYYLSRLPNDALSIVTISANHPDLAAAVDERTYSSLHPRELTIDPYTVTETYQILDQHARTALTRDCPFPTDALTTIATGTANSQLALYWLDEAAEAADEQITEDLVHETRPDAVRRYRDHLLEEFSPHHRLLCDAVENLTDDTDLVHTGAIYDQYEQLCRSTENNPLTTRRLSDFLKDLELLGIIEADYHYGGADGKTREIQLQHI